MKYPVSEWTIRQQTMAWDVHILPIAYEIVRLYEYDSNVKMFWKWIFLKESFYENRRYFESRYVEKTKLKACRYLM